jgi:hypothetical protein
MMQLFVFVSGLWFLEGKAKITQRNKNLNLKDRFHCIFYHIKNTDVVIQILFEGWNLDLLVNFGQFPCSWIRIRIRIFNNLRIRIQESQIYADIFLFLF